MTVKGTTTRMLNNLDTERPIHFFVSGDGFNGTIDIRLSDDTLIDIAMTFREIKLTPNMGINMTLIEGRYGKNFARKFSEGWQKMLKFGNIKNYNTTLHFSDGCYYTVEKGKLEDSIFLHDYHNGETEIIDITFDIF